MSKYQDRNSMYHDKPVENGDPRSNNGWIYSAYSQYLAPETLDHMKLLALRTSCTKSMSPLKITRLPGKETPPQSKDEIIGLISLGLLSNEDLRRSHYNFSSQDVEFERKLSLKSVYKAIKALYAIRNEHRNYIWENKVLDGYPLAFRLAPWDIFYVKKMAGKRPSLLETTLFYLNAYTTIKKGNKSVRMMLWLQLADMKHYLLKYIPLKDYVLSYFGPEHTFYTNITSSEVK